LTIRIYSNGFIKISIYNHLRFMADQDDRPYVIARTFSIDDEQGPESGKSKISATAKTINPEGKIRVDYMPPKTKNRGDHAGDFVEYEEIKN